LTEALAEETKRRESAEQQAGEMGEQRSQLEAQLAQNKQAQAIFNTSWRIPKATAGTAGVLPN